MMGIVTRVLFVGGLGFLLLVAAGCDDSSPVVKKAKPALKTTKTVTAKVAPAVPQRKVEEYVYNSNGQRDPFEPLLRVKRSVAGGNAPLTPLQKFDLGQFKIMGIIIGKGEPRAMVSAPDGKSYILKSGLKIGKNNGQITQITDEGITVRERYYDFSGAVRAKTQMIKLPPRRGF